MILFVAGFFGGVIRGLAGIIKQRLSAKTPQFRPLYFFGMASTSGIIGLAASVAAGGFSAGISFSPAMAFVVGYAGSDFLENLYRILFKKISGAVERLPESDR